jgi:hypothetical protein
MISSSRPANASEQRRTKSANASRPLNLSFVPDGPNKLTGPLNHIQVELLRRFRADDREERSRRGIHLTINGIAAGLPNSG